MVVNSFFLFFQIWRPPSTSGKAGVGEKQWDRQRERDEGERDEGERDEGRSEVK